MSESESRSEPRDPVPIPLLVSADHVLDVTLSNWTERSMNIWKNLLSIKDRRIFEQYFAKGQTWGTLIETLRIAVQLYSTRFRMGPLYFKTQTSNSAKVLCRGCSEFQLRFFKACDDFWRVTLYTAHFVGCILDEEEKDYFMKPRELALLIKSKYTSLPYKPLGLQEMLVQMELLPHNYTKQQIFNLTSEIMVSIRSPALLSLTPYVALPEHPPKSKKNFSQGGSPWLDCF